MMEPMEMDGITMTEGRNINFNGSTRIVLWMLGVFGSVMIVLMTLVLQAIYSTNGAVNKLAGQQLSAQSQIQNMQAELGAFQTEMIEMAQRKHP
jgi:uncharacterized membrane protein (DUF106 family)